MEIQEYQECELLDVLYSAAGETTLWDEFLTQVALHLEAPKAALISIDPASNRSRVHLFQGWPADKMAQYNTYYGALDIWYLGYKKKNLRGWTGTGTSLCPASEVRKTEFCHDFLRPADSFHECGLIRENQAGKLTVLTFGRSLRQADFNSTHVQFLERLAPHLTGALYLHRKILDLKDAATAAANVLDALDVALVGLDVNGRICFMNASAKALLRSGEVLGIQEGKIAASDAREAVALDQLLKAACTRDFKSELGGAITVHKGNRSLHVTVLPLAGQGSFLPVASRVCLTLTDPDASPKSRATLLVSLFGLTPAETRIAMLIAHGLESAEIARRTRTSSHTVRSHLKSIFQKTRVTRQSQLMRLISRLPGWP